MTRRNPDMHHTAPLALRQWLCAFGLRGDAGLRARIDYDMT